MRTQTRQQARDSRGHFLPASTTPSSLGPDDWDDSCHHGQQADPRPRLSLVKNTASRPPVRPGSHTKPPVLPRRFPAAPTQDGTIAYAAHAAAKAGIPARILAWRIRLDGAAYQYLPDGTLLTHPGVYGAPITAITTCTHGAAHARLVTSLRGLYAAMETADHCPVLHSDFTGRPAAYTREHTTATGRPAPTPARARDLTDAFASRHTTATTRVMPLHEKPTDR